MATTLTRAAKQAHADLDAKGRHIVREAGKLFLSKGVSESSMDDVARVARASKATIYARFASKEDLFCAVVMDICAAAPPSPDAAAATDLRGRLTALGTAVLDRFRDPVMSRLLERVVGAKAATPELAQLFWEVGPGDAARAAERALQAAGAPKGTGARFITELAGPVVLRAVFGLRDDSARRGYVAGFVDDFLHVRGLDPDA